MEEDYISNINRLNFILYKLIKRLCDLVISIVIGIITFPIVLIAIAFVKLESPGRAIYSQSRVGLDNNEFTIKKIRSMYIDAEKKGAQWAVINDSRITKVGAVIRKSRIDELPQLLNVLKGEMSLIGPRPEREIFIVEFEKKIPDFRDRLKVKPGLSGYAQVNGGYDITAEEKLILDMYYINNQNLILDLKIAVKTIIIIFTGDGAR